MDNNVDVPPRPSEITKARGDFLTHSHYICALDWAIGATYAHAAMDLWSRERKHHDVLNGLASAVKSSQVHSKLGFNVTADLDAIRDTLRIAWGSELLLAITAQFATDEMIAVANNWAVVQAYYAICHSVQSLLLARGQARPTTHPETQKRYTDFWVTTDRQLLPWSLGLGSGGYCNLPSGVTIKYVKLWANYGDENCWDWVGKALLKIRKTNLEAARKSQRTEKRAALRKVWEASEKRRQEEGKRPTKPPSERPVLTPSEKQLVDRRLQSVTIFDYILSLRMRSQYNEPKMFVDGPIDASESRSVNSALCHIVSATLLVHELLVAKTIGNDAFKSILSEWATLSGTSTAKTGIHTRLSLLT